MPCHAPMRRRSLQAVRTAARGVVLAVVALQLLLHAASGQTTFLVQVSQDNVDKVVATYIQQGFVIKQRNNQYNYLVVEDPATSHVVSRAEAQAAVTATRQAAQPLNASEAQAAAAAVSQARQSRDINLVPTAIPATPKSTIAVRAIDAAKSRLAGVDGVAGVQHSPRVQLLGRSRYSRRGVDDSGLAVVSSASKYRRRLSTASCPTETLDTYGTQAGYVDMVTGRTSEEAPYGISMIQADFSTMTDISSNYNGKVLFCVIDDGLDVNNPEFSPASTKGCTPGAVRPITKTYQNCTFPWNQPIGSHGTHTSGTIAAERTDGSPGIAGVSRGAQLYHVNVFGPNEYGEASDIMDAWVDCVEELAYRKVATNITDMKMVISMSLGWQETSSGSDVVHDLLTRLATQHPDDILWVAAAGNDGKAVVNDPAGYPEVVSVAAVDHDEMHADFSNTNSDVEWAAAGVDILSTLPMGDAACRSQYNSNIRIVSGSTFTNELTNPWPYFIEGSGNSSSRLTPVTARVVDCGLGLSPCANAGGKICLIQLNWPTYYCKQAYNCMQGGGVGVLIYHSNRRSIIPSGSTVDICATQNPLSANCTMPDCTPVSSVNDESLEYPDDSSFSNLCPTMPAHGFAWPVAMGISLGQGKAVKAALQLNPSLQITLDPCGSTTGTVPAALGFMSGTSMATPAAAGVAGLVWSAHSQCTATEIRAAVSASALDKGTPGLDQSFGRGIVQAAAAHQYLLTHPCKAGAVTQMGSAEWAQAYQGTVDTYLQSVFGTSDTVAYNKVLSTCKQETALTGTLTRTTSSTNGATACQAGCYSQYTMTLYKGATCNIALLQPTWAGGGCLSGVGVVTWKSDGTWAAISGMFPAGGSGVGTLFTMQYVAGNQATAQITSVDSATPCTTQYTLSTGLTQTATVQSAAVSMSRSQMMTCLWALAIGFVFCL